MSSLPQVKNVYLLVSQDGVEGISFTRDQARSIKFNNETIVTVRLSKTTRQYIKATANRLAKREAATQEGN